jgi:hypothetical protein
MKYYLVSIGECNGEYEYSHAVLLHTADDDIEVMLGHLGATWYGGAYDPEMDVFDTDFSNGDVTWQINEWKELSQVTWEELNQTFITDLSNNYNPYKGR